MSDWQLSLETVYRFRMRSKEQHMIAIRKLIQYFRFSIQRNRHQLFSKPTNSLVPSKKLLMLMGKEDLQYFYAELTGDSLSPSLGCDIFFFFEICSVKLGLQHLNSKFFTRNSITKKEHHLFLWLCVQSGSISGSQSWMLYHHNFSLSICGHVWWLGPWNCSPPGGTLSHH